MAIGREGSLKVSRYAEVYWAAFQIANGFEAHQHELWLCAGGLGLLKTERITLRAMALRHHNRPLHFVPYGALGSARNNARDWVIEKFNLPLPIDMDSEKVRKLIKKVGEAMLQDPEVGHLLREPLKGKLSRIDPGVKIFRCKFETAPGKQFDVRAQALKRLEEALRAAGILFADGRQTIFIQKSGD